MSDPESQAPHEPLLDNPTASPVLSQIPETIRRNPLFVSAYNFFTHNCMGFLFGLITAFALKTVGQTIAVLVVLAFIGIQCLAYCGYVKFNWSTVAGSIARQFDFNQDGQLTWADAQIAINKFWSVFLAWGVPSTVSFLIGFYLGWKIL
mmetsp:Transcript_13961/g.24461  ORF Transcript_13961/g.24461 Transcript_13961/m.24461 type:complete len:149 (-) Transcript_13961:662-1108(-)|eukprot:CAMPEP_0175061950 /NCGR_PEP_ID=MMETSP0052_2-20121109/13876_1 /TAXON_ID=51329 ORGANISM="Polytomella parva, Strain SAG 63-3" /NCGR_SAMPLE_ID=MMETSP0052_2 /ASSEMBLY_ACC=CAM_ASM_000194 /LENGTH=148 /DNA_ID=CAMNT_0016327875 /DNA_START=63 /DNA_END=509 /DNA_ORIENTATION=-